MAPALELLETPVKGLPTKALPLNHGGTTSGDDLKLESTEKHQRVMNIFRVFIADLCQQFGEGHAGSPMGMAAIGVALYKYVMRYSPTNCDYFNRDRFVLSNGKPHRMLFQDRRRGG
ncbi:unnamed protein product [Penicillium salamii]|uniref:Transketolase N-terminal domain-containing protein n=1 Tax=Penicillium salamii TaxID=1612424 RepID=A0A9W4IL80_9EURO|nr:unnamed protein product [Penicillium salamii]